MSRKGGKKRPEDSQSNRGYLPVSGGPNVRIGDTVGPPDDIIKPADPRYIPNWGSQSSGGTRKPGNTAPDVSIPRGNPVDPLSIFKTGRSGRVTPPRGNYNTNQYQNLQLGQGFRLPTIRLRNPFTGEVGPVIFDGNAGKQPKPQPTPAKPKPQPTLNAPQTKGGFNNKPFTGGGVPINVPIFNDALDKLKEVITNPPKIPAIPGINTPSQGVKMPDGSVEFRNPNRIPILRREAPGRGNWDKGDPSLPPGTPGRTEREFQGPNWPDNYVPEAPPSTTSNPVPTGDNKASGEYYFEKGNFLKKNKKGRK